MKNIVISCGNFTRMQHFLVQIGEYIVMTREEKAELVKKMRKITMAGTMDCKKCLERMDYDLDKAILYLKTEYGRYVTIN